MATRRPLVVVNGVTSELPSGDTTPTNSVAPGTARQLLQTNAGGTATEWTSNVDVPGTLDVTSTATFDSIAQYPAGSAGAPTITFTGDTNTGIYSPGADQVAISTGGSGRLFVDASGHIGLTASASAWGDSANGSRAIQIGGSSWYNYRTSIVNFGHGYYYDASDNYRYVYTGVPVSFSQQTAGEHRWFGASSGTAGNSFTPLERMRLDSSGRLGVGTSSPGTSLDVRGIISLGSSSLANAVIQKSAVPGGSFNLTITSGGGLTSESATTPTDALAGSVIKLLGGDPTTDTFGGGIQYYANGSTSPNGAGVGNQHVFYTRSAANTYTERLRIDASGRVGVGTTSPSANLHVSASSGTAIKITETNNGVTGALQATSTGPALGSDTNHPLVFYTNAVERLRIDSSGRVGIGTSSVSSLLHLASSGPVLTLQRSDSASPGAAINFTNNTSGVNWQIGTNQAVGGSAFEINSGNQANNRFVITSGGLVGIGTTSPTALLTVNGTGVHARFQSGAASDGRVEFAYNTTDVGFISATDANTFSLWARSGNALSLGAGGLERARIDSSGRLLVGTSSSASTGTESQYSKLQVVGNVFSAAGHGVLSLGRGEGATNITANEAIGFISFSDNTGGEFAYISCLADANAGSSDYPGRLVFSTTADGASSPTERMRITQAGNVLINKAVTSASVAGIGLEAVGTVTAVRSSDICYLANRLTTDGSLFDFYQDTNIEGSISVSGSTVSYNGAHLSRWSQIPGIDPHDKDARPEILRGTVMSNLDEMCDWIDPKSGDAQNNEQLNKTKISDVEGDKNVAGIFQSWDDDDDTWMNDYYLAMTGDFVIRIAEGVTVERGDLLMSAGDGTAKPQDDDIIRSKTIAKVTSTTVSCIYDDGSYCVPCVLMAC